MAVTDQMKRRILLKTNGKCFYCGRELTMRKKSHVERVTVDHYIPLSRGGYNEDYNRVPACKKCNGDKGNLLPEEYEQKRGKFFGNRNTEEFE